jgi:dephospho-CoA kinase
MTKKIGLAGKSGSGKDVVANYISERYGYKKVAVADALKIEIYDQLVNPSKDFLLILKKLKLCHVQK